MQTLFDVITTICLTITIMVVLVYFAYMLGWWGRLMVDAVRRGYTWWDK